jgi:hypothetical protein
MLLGDGLKLLLVVDQRRVGHLLTEIFITGFELVEAVEHGYSIEKTVIRMGIWVERMSAARQSRDGRETQSRGR